MIIPLFEAQVAIGGRSNQYILPNQYINHITQRSDEVHKGSLFVALIGKRVDAHDFIKEVEQQGAVGVVVEYFVEGVNIPQIQVPCCELALADLAKIWRSRRDIPLVAITGSVGKTSTKELVSHVLEGQFNTHKSRKNFNNELGVPIELLHLQDEHQCSVMEFGMRGLNQINYLARLARPTFGVITNIGMSHIEILKSRENIAKAKAEILQGMDQSAILFLNHDDDFYGFIADNAKCEVISVGFHENSTVRISDLVLDDQGYPSFKLNEVSVKMSNCLGKHNAYNAAFAFAIATQMGMQQHMIAKQISSFQAPDRRGSLLKLKNGAMLLDNTYNAAPDSIQSSLITLSDFTKHNKRAIAVIGEMLELGDYSKEAHTYVGQQLTKLENKVDVLFTVGEHARWVGVSSGVSDWQHFDNIDLALHTIQNSLEANDVILAQGSNGVRLNVLVEHLIC